jgi:hypothetical protein
MPLYKILFAFHLQVAAKILYGSCCSWLRSGWLDGSLGFYPVSMILGV